MTQSNVIAGALAIAFVIFITVRGELPDYIHLFTVKADPKKSGSGGDSPGANFMSSMMGTPGMPFVDDMSKLVLEGAKLYLSGSI